MKSQKLKILYLAMAFKIIPHSIARGIPQSFCSSFPKLSTNETSTSTSPRSEAVCERSNAAVMKSNNPSRKLFHMKIRRWHWQPVKPPRKTRAVFCIHSLAEMMTAGRLYHLSIFEREYRIIMFITPTRAVEKLSRGRV